MATDVRRGYLIIADISGYTAFLTGTELEHAHGVLSTLIQTILDTCRPPIELVELEGDAVYVYLPVELGGGQTLLDSIEATYFAFATQREALERATSCTCLACRSVPMLDLKFVVHYGEFLLQRLAGRAKPIGPDVILVHRLLKNHIAEVFGLRAYLFLTHAASERLGLNGAARGWQPHAEAYEHLGTVEGAVWDLGARWARERASRTTRVAADAARVQHSVALPAPPAVVWEYLTAPHQRVRWQPGLRGLSAAGSLLAAGVEAHCDHGDTTRPETILDWRPFEYFTHTEVAAVPLRPPVLVTTELAPDGAGTRVTWYLAPAAGLRAKLGVWASQSRLAEAQRLAATRLQELVAAEWRPREEAAVAPPLDVEAAVSYALAHPEPAS